MLVRLFPRTDNDDFLMPRDVIARIEALPLRVVVDWARGNAEVQSRLDNLLAMRAPDVIVESHRSHFDESPHLEISLRDQPNRSLAGIVWRWSVIELEPRPDLDLEFTRNIVEQIANALEYDYAIEAAP